MESIIVIVGFLGAGKTTLLRHLVEKFLEADWNPYVVLNDYENALLDSQQISGKISPNFIKPLKGSCICCSGINELRELVNKVPERDKGVTLIEANGTSDACSLMGFLGVGIDPRFRPPIQISVVDVKNFQKRGHNNQLEANQVQVSSLILLSHLTNSSPKRIKEVELELKKLNPSAKIVKKEQLDVLLLPDLEAAGTIDSDFDHKKSHWASCSIDLPKLPSLKSIDSICSSLPDTILRVKGCTEVDSKEGYTYFERCPDGTVYIRPYRGIPKTGPKLVTIGPGSSPETLSFALENGIKS